MKLVEIPPSVLSKARLKQLAAQAAQQDFATYLQGCLDTLGLKGDWELDLEHGRFVPRKEG